jgi:hypothetical protein
MITCPVCKRPFWPWEQSAAVPKGIHLLCFSRVKKQKP